MALFARILAWLFGESFIRRDAPFRLSLESYGENISFDKLLPRRGTAERWVTAKGGGAWVLFHLDAPLQHDQWTVEYLLLKSRWQGYQIGGPQETSVFVVLVPDVTKVADKFKVSVQDSLFVSWALVRSLEHVST
jgi:hypothetical protein